MGIPEVIETTSSLSERSEDTVKTTDSLSGEGAKNGGLKRQLKERHIQMIAIGSNIGTGFFVGTGAALATGGPLSLVVAFIVLSGFLTVMMQCLGEMSCLIPVSGSFTSYATRFFDRSLGFAMGWQYWLCFVSAFAAESSAFVILINYWNTDTRLTPLWISIYILANIAVHLFPVRVFGEVEFIISTLKVITITALIILICVIIGGGGPSGSSHGVEYWHEPGLTNGVANGFYGFASVFVIAGFSAGGTEMMGVAVGEAQHPRYNFPRAIRTLMGRIFVFYVLSMLLLTFVVPYNDKSLAGENNANSSPFVIAIKNAGIPILPDLLNAIIMVCVVAVGSTQLYTGSRILKALAQEGFAPRLFSRTDREGRPYMAIAFSTLMSMALAYCGSTSSSSVVFTWFSSISGLTIFIAETVVIACNWRFRAALKAQGDKGLERKYQYRATLWPYLSIVAFVVGITMILFQFIVAIRPATGTGSVESFFYKFLGGITFPLLYLGHKIIRRDSLVPLAQVDLQTGRIEVDEEEEAKLERYHGLTRWQKILSYARL